MKIEEPTFLGLPYFISLFIIIPLCVSLLFSIWAIFDISRLTITRKEKSSLIAFIISYPFYGVITYIFYERPKLKKREP